MRRINAALRDFVNAKGTRYTKMPDYIGMSDNTKWVLFGREEDYWKVRIRTLASGRVDEFHILPPIKDGTPLTGVQAWHVAMEMYRVTVLGEKVGEGKTILKLEASSTKH